MVGGRPVDDSVNTLPTVVVLVEVVVVDGINRRWATIARGKGGRRQHDAS